MFGIPPHKRASSINDPDGVAATSGVRKQKARASDWIKSPYNTPIINDTKLLPSASVTRAKALIKQRQLDKLAAQNGESKDEIGVNVYETYVSHDNIERIKKCWTLLCDRFGESDTFLSQFMSTYSTVHKESTLLESNNKEGVNGDGLEPTDSELLDNTMGASFAEGHGKSDVQDSFAPDTFSTAIEDCDATTGQEKLDSTTMFQSSLDVSTAIATDISNNKFMRIKYLDSSNKEMGNSLLNHSITHASGSAIGGQTGGVGLGNNTTMRFGATDIATQPFIWSSHDVKLQRAVHRKGGELFNLTAAGTQGRMKAPHRKVGAYED